MPSNSLDVAGAEEEGRTCGVNEMKSTGGHDSAGQCSARTPETLLAYHLPIPRTGGFELPIVSFTVESLRLVAAHCIH